MSFLNVKIMLLFYIISRHGTSLGPKGLNFGPVDVDMFSTDCQLSYGLNCFFTVKTYQGQDKIFCFEISSCPILYIWNQLVLCAPPNYFQHVSSKLQTENILRFQGHFWQRSNPETLKLFALLWFASLS